MGKRRRSPKLHLDWQTHLLVLAADSARALLLSRPLESRGRREDRVLTSHPRSAARKAHAGRTAQQHTGGANHSAFPAQWLDGLCRALPGAEFVLASLALTEFTGTAPVDATAASQRLDRSNDGQDHTVLPYARPAISPQSFQPCRRSRKLTGETNLTAPFVCTGPEGSQDYPALPSTSRARHCRVHRKPGSRK